MNLDRFRELRPDGYIQCGIAEQNLIEVASACANEGFHVFAPCYATFVTSRTLDQIRVNLGMMKSPVVLVGVAAGCESAATGPSHMAVEDIAVTRTIPGLSTPFAFAWTGTVRIGAIACIEPLIERMACEDGAPATGKDGKPDPAGPRGKKTPGKPLHAKAGNEDRVGAADDQADRAKESRRRDMGAEESRRSRTCTEQTANPSAARDAARQDPFARAEQEDDDGYDPYSDRPPEPEPVFQRDPWA